MSTPSTILSRPLNVFALPPDLLDNLAVRTIQQLEPEPKTTLPPNGTDDQPTKRFAPDVAAAVGVLRCQTCPNASFDTPDEQRDHFKSDWHRYNAKARLTGRAVTAEEWENLVEGISSISGSASSSSSGSSVSQSQPQSKLSRLLAKQRLNSRPQSEDDEEAELEDQKRRAQLRTATIWFQPTSSLSQLGIPQDTQFGTYRALFPNYDNAAEYLQALKDIQLEGGNKGKQVVNGSGRSGEQGERRMTLLMVAGGHFAGMVVGLRQQGKNEKQLVKGAGEVRVLQHKTFHRYTTRRKQGGSQGLNDNAKSKANSAGAMLRRYGEQALQDDIRALMTEWRDDIEASEKVFIRASTHGKRSFWGYEGAVLDKSDDRIRVFPFPTRRPTQQELLRCWHELTRIKISHLTQEALAALDEAYIASIQPKKAIAKPTPAPTPTPSVPAAPKLSPEEEAKLDRSKRIEDMIRKGRLEPLQQIYEKYPSELDISHLALASSQSQEEIVKFILTSTTIDPSEALDGGRRTYDLSGSKGVRNVYRRIAFEFPEKYDWTSARVPSGLSEEAELAQEKKKVERRKGLKEKMKERQAVRAEQESKDEEVEAEKLAREKAIRDAEEAQRRLERPNGAQKLGGGGGGSLAGMSGDMRAQVERERRARAAEARFKTTS